MQIQSFASGSGGNCALVSGGGKYILVDAGISLRRIKACLAQRGLNLCDISAVLLTHEHGDHVGALPMIEKYTDIPVITSGGTARNVMDKGKVSGKNFIIIEAGAVMDVGGIAVRSFATSHDAAESLGYVFELGYEKIAAVTDLGRVTTEVRSAVSGATAVLLEANHDVDMLRAGSYPYQLQQRILGPCGHLSNEASGRFALELSEQGAKHILLAHLSKENNTPRLAYKTVADILINGGVEPGSLRLNVAPPDEMSCILET
ncbi:MAG: MBL fold metallo-hydrolase [Clostridiales bacterium]|nr:MBL fold metallo-hydrolase [Clostridiales bacterium]